MNSPSRSDFPLAVARLVTERFPLVKVEPEQKEFSLRLNGHIASLENLYRVVMQEPESLQHHVERWVVELLRASEGRPDDQGTFEEMKHRLYPMVVSGPPGGPADDISVTDRLVEGLMVAYAIDSDRTITYLPKGLFEAWDVDLEEVHEAAVANLMAKSEELQARAAQDEAGTTTLVLIQTMDGYDASRILLPTLHERLRPHLGSPFLVGIPNRDILICFRNDAEMVKRLRTQIATDYQTMPHQVSDRLFLSTPDGIAPYEENPPTK